MDSLEHFISFEEFNTLHDLFFNSKYNYDQIQHLKEYEINNKIINKINSSFTSLSALTTNNTSNNTNNTNIVNKTNKENIATSDSSNNIEGVFLSNAKVIKAYLLIINFKYQFNYHLKEVKLDEYLNKSINNNDTNSFPVNFNINSFNDLSKQTAYTIYNIPSTYIKNSTTLSWKAKDLNILLKFITEKYSFTITIENLIKIIESEMNKKNEKSFEINLSNFNTMITIFQVIIKFNYLAEYFKSLYDILDRECKGIIITAEMIVLLNNVIKYLKDQINSSIRNKDFSNSSSIGEVMSYYVRLSEGINSNILGYSNDAFFNEIIKISI